MSGRHFRKPPDGSAVAVVAEAEAARLAAISEAVERYCFLADPPEALLVEAPYLEVEHAAVAPHTFAMPSIDQYRSLPSLAPLSKDKVIDWCWGYSLTRRRSVLLPGALAYPGLAARPHNNYLPEVGSSGLACHPFLPQAVLSGLCEVLERDALTIAWCNRLPLTPLDPAGTLAEQLILGPLATPTTSFQLFQVPTDAPLPVLLAVAWKGEQAAVGAACRPHPVDGAVKALYEACQSLYWLDALRPALPDQIREFDDHASFYGSPHGNELLREHLVIQPCMEPLAADPPGEQDCVLQLTRAVEALGRLGLEVVVADLTTADVAATGFRVVRVLVPGMIEMPGNPGFTPLAAPRLHELPVRLGLHSRPLDGSALNLLPVPLA